MRSARQSWRIAYLDHAVDFGGAENSLSELIGRLDRDRFIPTLLHTTGAQWLQHSGFEGIDKIAVFQPHELFDQKRDEVATGGLGQLIGNAWATLRLAWPVRRTLEDIGADLIHTNSLKAHFIGGLAARLARRPLLWHVRDLLAEEEGLGLLRGAARMLRPDIIAISQAVAQQFAELSVEVVVIPNGIPLEKFTPGPKLEQLRRELGLSEEDQIALIVGRLTPWKGHQELLEAISILVGSRPRLKLIVVGEVAFWEDNYEQQLKQQAAELGVADRVVWTGFRTDVPDLLRLCDVFVLPSVNEPFGRAIIEAMAVGCPVVATDSGGVPEVVQDGETGMLVPPGEPEALAQAIETLLADPGKAEQMGRAGLSRAREKFNADRVARQVQQLYERVLSRRA